MSISRSLGWKVTLAAGGLLAVSSALSIHALWRTRAEQDARIARLEAGNRRLASRNEMLEREAAGLAQRSAAPQEEPRPESPHGKNAGDVNALERAKLLIQFRDQMMNANRTVESLQNRLQELQFSLEKAAEENKRLAASEADLKEKVAVNSRVIEAVQTELKGKQNRVAELDAANRRLSDENRTRADKLAELPRALQELEQINRRREGYLTGILRRYRDITDQYRAVSARLDRDNSASGISELGGIQNTISMAEEDLRQLAALNAQAVRFQQKLSAK
jgi:chromosome segregation ATPase